MPKIEVRVEPCLALYATQFRRLFRVELLHIVLRGKVFLKHFSTVQKAEGCCKALFLVKTLDFIKRISRRPPLQINYLLHLNVFGKDVRRLVRNFTSVGFQRRFPPTMRVGQNMGFYRIESSFTDLEKVLGMKSRWWKAVSEICLLGTLSRQRRSLCSPSPIFTCLDDNFCSPYVVSPLLLV